MASRLREGLFTLLFHIRKGTRGSRATYLLSRFLRFLQTLALLINASLAFPWRPSTVEWLDSILKVVNFGVYVTTERAGFGVVLDVAIVTTMVAVLVSLVFVAAELHQAEAVASATVRVIRAWAVGLQPLLVIPFSWLFGSALVCGSGPNHFADSGMVCWGSAHALRASGAIIALISLAILAILIDATNMPRCMLHRSHRSRMHGRVHALETACLMALSVLFGARQDRSGEQWVLILAACFVVLTVGFYYLRYLPYYFPVMNRAALMQYTVLTWACACLVAAQVEDDAENNASALAFFLGAPAVAAVGWMAMDWRMRLLMQSPPSSFSNPLLFELRLRPLVFACIAKAGMSLRTTAGEMEASGSRTSLGRWSDYLVAHTLAGVQTGELALPGTQERLKRAVVDERSGHADWSSVLLVADALDWTYLERQYNVQARAQPGNALLPWMKSLIYDDIVDNPHLSLVELNKSTRMHPAWDVDFFLYARLRLDGDYQAHLVGKVQEGAMDPLAFAAFEQSMEKAASATQGARTAIVHFWQDLDEPLPDMNVLFGHGSRMYFHVRTAQTHFRRLLDLNAESPPALRLYASFLLEVLNDKLQAEELLAQADELEEAKARKHEHNAMRTHVDLSMATVERAASDAELFDDYNGVVALCTDEANMGEMTGTNPAFNRMLNYKRGELNGQNINVLVPHPMRHHHDAFMRRYMRTRKGLFMNNTRPAFILNKRGFISPFMLTLRESCGLETAGLQALESLGVLNSRDTETAATLKIQNAANASLRGGYDEEAVSTADLSQTTPGMKVVAVIQPIKNMVEDAMYVDVAGLITAWTSHCPTAFNRTADDVNAGLVRINDLIPGCFNIREGNFVKDNFTFLRCSSKGRRWLAKAEVVKLAVVEVTVFVLQIALRHDMVSDTDMEVDADFVAASCRRAGMEPGRVTAGAGMGAGLGADAGTGTGMGPSSTPGPSEGTEPPMALQRPKPPLRPPVLEMTQFGAGVGKGDVSDLSPYDGKAGSAGSGSATPLLMDASPAPAQAGGRGSDGSGGSGSGSDGRRAVARRMLSMGAGDAGGRTPDSAMARDADEGGDEVDADDTGPSPPYHAQMHATRLHSGVSGHQASPQPVQPAVYQEAAVVQVRTPVGEVSHRGGPGAGAGAGAAVISSASAGAVVMQGAGGVGRADDQRSMSSAGSSSAASTSHMAFRVRALRSLVERQGRNTDPTVRRLQRLMGFMLVLFGVLALIDVGVTQALMHDYRDALVMTNHANRRYYLVSTLLMGTMEHRYAHYGVVASEGQAAVYASDIDELHALHTVMFDSTVDGDSSFDAVHSLREIRGNITVSRVVSEWAAVYEFLAKASIVRDATLSSDQGRAAYAWLQLNGLSPVLELVSNAAFHSRQTAEDRVDRALLILLLLLCLKLLPIALSVVLGYVPALKAVENAKMDVLRLFLHIPRPVVHNILAQHKASLAQQTAAEDGQSMDASPTADDDDDLDEGGGLGTEQRGVLKRRDTDEHAPAHGRALGMEAGGLVAAAADEEKQALVGERDRDRDRERRAGRMREPRGMQQTMVRKQRMDCARLSPRVVALSIARFSVLYVVIAAFFVTFYLLSDVVADLCRKRLAAVQWSSRRAALIPNSQYLALNMIALPDGKGQASFEQELNVTDMTLAEVVAAREVSFHVRDDLRSLFESQLDEAVALGNYIVFGNDDYSLAGFHDDPPGDLQVTLMLDDGCVPFSGTVAANCSTAARGIMGEGLLAAVQVEAAQMREAVHFRDLGGTVRATVKTEAYADSELLESEYLRYSNHLSVDLFEADAKDLVDTYTTYAWVAVGVLCFICTLTYAFYYQPLTHRLDMSIRLSRALLLLVPFEVAHSVREIREFVMKSTINDA